MYIFQLEFGGTMFGHCKIKENNLDLVLGQKRYQLSR